MHGKGRNKVCWFDKCLIHHTYIVIQLYDVLRFDSIAVINVLINISSSS